MNAVSAERLIYTRVEAAFSPRRSSGFQTAWKSESLTPAEVAAVEKCVQCFRPVANLRRLQFFQIPTGKFVLSLATQIDAHPEIVDRNRRSGAFLVHCFLLTREEMARLENDPFRFFDANLPTENVEQLVETLGRGTGIVPSIQVVPVTGQPDLSDWAAPEAVRLLSVALGADDLRRQGRVIPVIGEIAQIEQTLRLALRLAPMPKRLACTFSTWAEGCPLEPGLFWASGLSKRPAASGLEIDARSKRVAMTSSRPGTADLYESWIKEACSHVSLREVLAQAETIDLFLRALDGTSLEGETSLRPEALTSFLNLHRHAVAEKLRGGLERQVRRPLAKELAYHLLAEIHRPEFRSLLEITVPGPSQISDVARLAAHWLECVPTGDEQFRPELQDLARRGNHMVLLFWASTLGRKADPKGRDEALSKMTGGDFQRALSKLLHPIEPIQFVDPKHLVALLESERLSTANESFLVELAERIIDIGGGQQLGGLTECLNRIGDKGLQRLARKIKKKDVAESFRRHLEIAVPKQQGILGRFL